MSSALKHLGWQQGEKALQLGTGIHGRFDVTVDNATGAWDVWTTDTFDHIARGDENGPQIIAFGLDHAEFMALPEQE